MQIRKIGPQPEDHFVIIPNALIRDSRLSYRARGVMCTLTSHEDGFHANADTLADGSPEGRDAIRKAMNELIDAGYLRRVRHQDEAGKWRTDINVYPYGDAPPIIGADAIIDAVVIDEDLTDDGFSGVGEPTTDFQSSVNQSSVSQAVIEDQEEDSSTSPSDAAGDHSPTEVGTGQQQDLSQPVTPMLPIVERRKLQGWFHITEATAAEAWEAAWATAQSFITAQPSVEYDPQAHLAIYLSKCREERRTPRSDLWLRFFIEDRAKHVQVLADERAKHAEETPQEREDRLNKRLPSSEWGAPVETGAQA